MNKAISRLMCLLLCAAMVLSLAACGNDGGKEPAATAAPEYVYSAHYTTIAKDNRYGLNILATTDKGAYTMRQVKTGEDIPEGVVPEYEGQYDVYEQQLWFQGFDGTEKRLEGYKQMEFVREHEDSDGSTYENMVVLAPDGTLYTITERYESWSAAPESVAKYSDEWYNYWQYDDSYYIRHLAADGSELSCARLEVPDDGEYFYINSMVLTGDGQLCVSGETGVYVFTAEGKLDTFIGTDGYWTNGLLTLKDGRTIVLMDTDNGFGARVLDFAGKSLGEAYTLPNNCWNAFAGGGAYDLYYTNGSCCYGVMLENGESTKLFNWIDCDVNPNDLHSTYIRDDGTVCGFMSEWDKNYETCDISLVEVTKEPYDPANERKVLTLATVWVNDDTIAQVIDFNRHNTEYRISVKDYSEYNTEDDYSAGRTKLYTEMLAGNMPDIIALGDISYKSLAERGLLMDLYPLIDADSELKREDFFPSVLQAAEIGGKLFNTVTTYSVNTCLGASSVVGDTPGWNYQQFNEALASMPEGCSAFEYYTTRTDVLSICLGMDMDSFVDWSTGTCHFDSQQFIDLLEFTAQFPASFDWDNYEYSEDDSTYARIAAGKQMLANVYLYSFDDLPYYTMNFGGKTTFIGYPTTNGTGSMLYFDTNNFYGISANTKYPDAAWQFVRTFFTEEYQDTLYGFRSNINSFNKMMAEAMEQEYEKDENGNYLLDENGERIPISKGGFWMEGSEEPVNIYATTQEEADQVLELIRTTTKCAGTMEEVWDIVIREVEAFYYGQKSAAEVAKLIQSKATIYINEQL